MSLQLIRPDINLDFVGKRYFFVILSTVINIAAIVLLLTRGLNYGVDFAGGSIAQIEFKQKTDSDTIRKSLASLDLGEVTVQDFGKAGRSYLAGFRAVKNIGSIGPKLESALEKTYGPGIAKVVRVESVSAKVGSDLRRRGFLAVIVATLIMGAYIAFQFRRVSWSFGAGAVIALIHDVLVVMGALVISQFQFDLTTLAAVLTVIGYSVHDTIIVSDRIREDSAKRRREPIESVMNRAINETLSRTILTSGTAIAVLISLLAFGGPILRPSAFTLLVGFITGTYSSIYIAGPVVLFWEGGRRVGAVSSRAA
ncbi:MAG: protein translocase subunit SecF [Candidatus Binatus sp.]|uniref:protein translocase subunit SecF n=1 Tax=Candidatus Binatus sp. TaxID=2811406 RepID=UPI002719E7A7|nr:protein translocase subunit SecF [Candidatus Binatus sp.]MDO8431126.1 protein translocase subunit SecF [Candidatus Binatus sp.]